MVPALLIAIAAAAHAPQAWTAAQDAAKNYPNRPVRLVLAQTTGSSVDTLSRVLASKLGDELGQQFVAANRGGAGGTIGAEIAAHAVPAAYTLLETSAGLQVIAPQIYKKLNSHPVRDFAQISLFAITQNVLVTHPGLPLKSVKELIAYAKANPGKLNMANAGSGFQSHLAGVLFTHMTEIDVLHVPYKGGASLIAVMGNEAQLTIAPGPAVLGHVRAGRLRALATGGEKRSPLTPELPTVIEAGVPGYVSTGWAGVMAPKATPKPILDKLHAGIVKVINDPATREMIERQGGEPVTSAPAEFTKFIGQEYARFSQAISIAKLKVE